MVDMKKKKNTLPIIGFIAGMITYLTGLFLLFGTTLTRVKFIRDRFPNFVFTNNSLMGIKILGLILFFIGFTIFMISVISLFKSNKIKSNPKDLIVEGKADMLTIIIMTYILIFMLVICIVFDQIIGSLLFGFAVLFQSALNTILIKYFKKNN